MHEAAKRREEKKKNEGNHTGIQANGHRHIQTVMVYELLRIKAEEVVQKNKWTIANEGIVNKTLFDLVFLFYSTVPRRVFLLHSFLLFCSSC